MTGQGASYPNQTAANYQANGTAGSVAPATGYQTGPYPMSGGQSAAAPAGGYAGAGATWNANAPTNGAGPANYGQAQQGYGALQNNASQNGAPQASGPIYTADQRSAVGYQVPASPPATYGQPAAGYQAPAANGYQNNYSPAPNGASPYGQPASGGSPYSNQGAANSTEGYQPGAEYQPSSGNAYANSPVADPSTIAPSQPSYSVPAYTPPAYATSASPEPAATSAQAGFTTGGPTRPVLPAALSSDAGGYRPGSTGRSEVQNARYDSPTGASSYNAAPAYGNTYVR